MDRIDRALKDLRDELPTVRKFAATNLGRYGDARAIPALEQIAWVDGDEAVRQEAERALSKLRELGVLAIAPDDLRVETAELAHERARLVAVLAAIRDDLAARLAAPLTAGALLAPAKRAAPAARPSERPKAPTTAEKLAASARSSVKQAAAIRAAEAEAALTLLAEKRAAEAHVAEMVAAEEAVKTRAGRNRGPLLVVGALFGSFALGVLAFFALRTAATQGGMLGGHRNDARADAAAAEPPPPPPPPAPLPLESPAPSESARSPANPFLRLAPGDDQVLASGDVAVEGILDGARWDTVRVATKAVRLDARLTPLGDRVRFQAKLSGLADGPHKLTVSADNPFGHAERAISVVVDSLVPAITLRTPAQRALIRADRVLVEGDVAARTPCKVFVNGESAAVSSAGRFSRLLEMEPGENRIEVTARNQVGNESTAVLTVTRAAPRTGAGPQVRIRVHPKDSAPMCYVPAGPFVMGENARNEAAPAHVVTLPAYYIDRLLVTWGRYRRFCVETVRPPRELGPEDARHRDDDPVTGVTRWDAAAYAAWAGKRLPSEAEWEKAARGDDARHYPWGNERPLPTQAPYGEERPSRKPKAVAMYPAGASPYGCCDMVGCIEQWCDDLYRPNYYGGAPAGDLNKPAPGQMGTVRGCAASAPWGERVRCAARKGLDPLTVSEELGFRCAVSEADFPK